MLADKNEYMEKAYEKLTKISADEEKRLEYEAREKAIRDHNYLMKANLEAGYKKGYDSGYDNGYGKGYNEGELTGAIKATVEAYLEFGLSDEVMVQKLCVKYNLKEEDARKYLEEYKE